MPYSDTLDGRLPARARHSRSAIEIRYVGTRSRQQWETFNYNEANILDNGFLDEFKAAQANLQSHIAAGCGVQRRTGVLVRVSRSGHRHVAAADLPGVLQRRAGGAVPARCARCTTSSSWTNSSFINPLGRVQLEPVHAGRHEREQRPRGRSRRGRRTRSRPDCRAELLPRQSRHARRRQRHRATAASRGTTRCSCSTAGGCRTACSSTPTTRSARAIDSEHFSFRVPRVLLRVDRRRGRRHARVQGDRRLRAAVRPWPPVRHATSTRCVDGFVGGWQVSGTHAHPDRPALRSRQRPRRRHDRSTKCRSLFKMRKESDTIIYCVAAGDHRRDDQGLQRQRDDGRPATARSDRRAASTSRRRTARTASRRSATTTAIAACARSSSRDRWS